MYNYSPNKVYREKTREASAPLHVIGSLDNLPAVPERHSSTSLFDNVNETSASHTVFNLYESIDNLKLNFDKESDSDDAVRGGGGGGMHKDAFQAQMEEIEHTMKNISRPRFQLPDRPRKLAENSDVFVDVDRSNTQRLELFLPPHLFSRGDVLCLDVVCVPSDMRACGLMDVCEGSYNKPVDHEPLEVSLSPAPPEDDDEGGGTPQARPHSPFEPVYHNGEYEFNLTSAHGISCGKYILSIRNAGAYTQSVRCKMKLRPYVKATTIDSRELVTVCDVPREEFCYFRFVLPERDRTDRCLVTVRLSPQPNAAGTASDPDLYVSNKYAGLVAVDRDSYIWRSTNIGVEQVDIHPDDVNAQRSGIFIIGVLGYRDVNSFSLEVIVSPPVRSLDLKPGSTNELLVRTDRYTFYRIPVDSSVKGKLVVAVSPVGEMEQSSDQRSSSDDSRGMEAHSELQNQFGRGVYTTDSLVSLGISVHGDSDGGGGGIGDLISAQLAQSPMRDSLYGGGGGGGGTGSGVASTHAMASPKESPIGHANQTHALLSAVLDSLPDSLAKKTGVYPVLHLSSDVLYPTALAHSWRATSILGPAKAMIEMDEWLHTSSHYCYLSVIGVALPRPSQQHAGSPSTPSRESGSAKLTSPILPTLGSSPVGTAGGQGRFIRSQNTVLELKTRAESVEEEKSAVVSSINCSISLDLVLDGCDLPPALQQRFKFFSSVFAGVDGSSISQKDRMARLPFHGGESGGPDTPSFTYGEIEFPGFVRLLEDVGARDGQVFVDLGSGTGRAVVAAALSGIKFLRCIGVEQLPGLCTAARVAIEKCGGGRALQPTQSAPSSQQHRSSQQHLRFSLNIGTVSSATSPIMEIWEGDMADTTVASGEDGTGSWWAQADIVFASSICFSDALMKSIFDLAKGLKRGSLFLTLKLPPEQCNHGAQFKLLQQQWVKMSWGRALVYVLQRL